MLFYRLLHYLTFKCASWNSPCAWPALKICMWYDHTKWQSNHPSWLIQWWKYSDNLRIQRGSRSLAHSLLQTWLTNEQEEFCWKSDYRERERELWITFFHSTRLMGIALETSRILTMCIITLCTIWLTNFGLHTCQLA